MHLVGKEIYTRFHATLWPAMLMALGLPLPRHVLGHGWWLIEGEKGSKSKGNIPDAAGGRRAIVARERRDAGSRRKTPCATICIRDISFTGDAEFSFDNLVEKRYNADLATSWATC